MRGICVFTGTRAEYGLLKPLMSAIKDDPDLQLRILVSGMHLSPEFGLTFQEIEKDGFTIDENIPVLLDSDSGVGICKSMGLGLIGYAEALERLAPDILIVLGDRFEAFSAAASATVCRIPLAHIHGGETTEGVIDEPFRHSITKMSHLHFVSTEEYGKRVIQLGEEPCRVFNVGALGVENIRKMKLWSREELERNIGFSLGEKYIVVTFHPVTLEKQTAQKQFQNLLDAVDSFSDLKIIFTKANADTEGRIINRMIDEYVDKNREKAIAFTSMGQLGYLSAMSHAEAVAGNSSSGIIEAPGLRVPAVNIGDRQKGRVRAMSVIDCPPDRGAVEEALKKSFSSKFKKKTFNISNPHEKDDTANAIKETIKFFEPLDVVKKRFFDIPFKLDKA